MTRLPGLEILVTAEEAYPRLEQLFLRANSSVVMGFRLFDMRTALRSPEGRAIGETWADLFLHTLNRGVAIDLALSDFDPVMAHAMHAQAWRLTSMGNALNEISEPGAAKITARCILHPAQGGILARLMFALKTRKVLRGIADDLTADAAPQNRLRFLPGLGGLLEVNNGTVRLRRFALPRLFPVTLHHKMAVFDDNTAYIGGLDLNERRYDGPGHDQAAQQTWHDVQIVVRDSGVAADAVAFLAALPRAIARQGAVPPPVSGFRTTVSRKRRTNHFHLAPEPLSDGLLREHLRQIGRARHLIYIETQYFRDRRIAAALARAARQAPALQLILVLPAAPEDAAFNNSLGLDGRFGEYLQTRAFRKVRKAFGQRFLAVSPVQNRAPDGRDVGTERSTLAHAPIIYVHAKVSIFDDLSAIVASANLNGRSMKWDAEAGVVLSDTAQVRALRARLFRYWLTDEAAAACFEAQTAVPAWRDHVRLNAARAPGDRVGFLVAHAVRPGAAAAVPMPGAPEEMV